jgi:phosphate-selective porin
VYIYIQPEFAASVPLQGNPTGHFVQIRDAYADLALDAKKEFRFRIGQSKIPFGFEPIQSSSNRLSLERNDAFFSAVPNERDLGMIFYWAPKHIRDRFKDLANHKLKGSGDYGVFGFGVYNGQTANRSEANDNLHIVSKISYPIEFKNGQIIEPGISGYTGRYMLGSDLLSSTLGISAIKGGNFDDRRAAASFVLYPKPFGFQAEYLVGKGPSFDTETSSIRTRSAHGGYAQVSYNLGLKNQLLIPYVKVQTYKGGKKLELDARFGNTKQAEFGVEWQPISAFELTTQYVISDRITKDGRNPNYHEKGGFLQIQAQFNY